MKILLIEDDIMFANGLNKALQREGFVVHCAINGKQAIKTAHSFKPELIILDLGLPDIDGMDVLAHFRTHFNKELNNKPCSDVPILILTARDSVPSKVNALDGGADDYLIKPFDMPELLARIRVLARRRSGGTNTSTSKIQIDHVVLDVANHSLSIDDVEQMLTRREFMVLKVLMENTGRIQTKGAIENQLYGWGEEITSNTIEVHISNLRKKLPSDFIETVRGVGYTIKRSSIS